MEGRDYEVGAPDFIILTGAHIYQVFYKDPPPTRLRSTAVKVYCERVARFLPFRNPQPNPDVIQKLCAPWQLVSLRQPSTKGRELPLQPWQLLERFRHPRVQRRCLLAIFQLVDGFWEILVHRDDFSSFEKAAKAADFQIDTNHRPGDPLASSLDSTPEDQREREELAGRAALAWLVSTEVDGPEASVASIYYCLVDLYRCRGLFVKKVQAFLEYKPDHGLSHRVFVTGYHHYMILETDNKKERVLKCKMVRLLNKQLRYLFLDTS